MPCCCGLNYNDTSYEYYLRKTSGAQKTLAIEHSINKQSVEEQLHKQHLKNENCNQFALK